MNISYNLWSMSVLLYQSLDDNETLRVEYKLQQSLVSHLFNFNEWD